MVGTCGKVASRRRLATPMARNFPDWICGIAVDVAANIRFTCPASRSFRAGAMPL
jgi:hypothetical protein